MFSDYLVFEKSLSCRSVSEQNLHCNKFQSSSVININMKNGYFFFQFKCPVKLFVTIQPVCITGVQ